MVSHLNTKKSSLLEVPVIQNQIGTVAIYLYQQDYHTMGLFFGFDFVEEVLRFFEEIEDYERCAVMVQQLRIPAQSSRSHQELLACS